MGDFLEWVGGTGRRVTVSDLDILLPNRAKERDRQVKERKAEPNDWLTRPGWMDRLEYVWPREHHSRVTETFEDAWMRLTDTVRTDVLETWDDGKAIWERRHPDFVISRRPDGVLPNVYRIDWTLPAWTIGLVQVWAEDECLRNDPDATRLPEAWQLRYGESLPEAVEKWDAGDAFYSLHPNGAVSCGSYDGSSIHESPTMLRSRAGRPVPNAWDARRHAKAGLVGVPWIGHRPLRHESDLNGYRGTWEVEFTGGRLGLYRLRPDHPRMMADPVSSIDVVQPPLCLDDDRAAWTRLRPADRCPAAEVACPSGRITTRCVLPSDHADPCRYQPVPDLPLDWLDVLYRALEASEMQVCRARLLEDRRTGQIQPAMPDVFRAFRETPFWAVQVVILGQDPYPGGQADGLAFSARQGPIPASLRNIIREVETDTGQPWLGGPDLTGWAQQGVLLLNTSLTCLAGQPGSHSAIGWQALTDAALLAVLSRPVPTVVMAWGQHAKDTVRRVQKALPKTFQAGRQDDWRPDRPRHLILEAPHPSPLAKGFEGCGHFRAANGWLARFRLPAIDWHRHHGK